MDEETFDSLEAEARYWRSTAKELQDALESVSLSSNSLADELLSLENDLKVREETESKLQGRLEKGQQELIDIKTKYQSTLKDHANTLSLLQREVNTLRKSEQDMHIRLRDMELSNDDLEKTERTLAVTLNDMENRYHRSLERIALLEEELVQNARLEEQVQRLKDELKDANEEMFVVKEKLADRPAAPSRPLTPPGARHGLPGGVAEGHVNADSTPVAKKFSTEPVSTERKWTPYRSLIPSVSRQTSPAHPGSTPPSLPRSISGLPPIKRSTPKAVREERTQTVLSDLKAMTDRVKQLKARVDSRAATAAAGTSLPRLRRVSTATPKSSTPGSLEAELSRAVSPTASRQSVKRPPSRLSIMTSASSLDRSRPGTPSMRRPTTPSNASFLAKLQGVQKQTSPSKKRLSLQSNGRPSLQLDRRPLADHTPNEDAETW